MTNKQLTKHFDLIIKSGTVATTDAKETCDIGIQNGKILELGDLSQRASADTIDAKGLHILPGIIDSQVHFREPGNELKEDMLTGSLAAILGGVTTVFEMTNTSPPTTTENAFKDKLRRAKDRYHCDYGFFVGASPENIPALPTLEQMPGCSGVKIFMGSSTGSLLIPTDELLSKVLESGVRRAAVHSEDDAILNESIAHFKYALHCCFLKGKPSLNAGSSICIILRPFFSKSKTSSNNAKAICLHVISLG